MAVEEAEFISGLDPRNPDGSDPIAEGDNHIRIIKAALQGTFPKITGEVTASHEELNELTGLARLPDAPTSDGSMIYSSGGKWVETSDIFINDGSGEVDLSGDLSVSGSASISDDLSVANDLSVGGNISAASFTVGGDTLLDYTAYAGGNGINVNGRSIAMSGSYSGTFTATDVVATSDERAKDKIEVAPSDVIAAISGKEWVWKDTGKKGSGVIAQELEAAGLDHLVHTNDDGMKAVSYNGLFAYVIEELKALRAAYERDCK